LDSINQLLGRKLNILAVDDEVFNTMAIGIMFEAYKNKLTYSEKWV
jgi:hypothetical protein